MSLGDLVESARSWYHARDLRETLYARALDAKALLRAARRRLRRML